MEHTTSPTHAAQERGDPFAGFSPLLSGAVSFRASNDPAHRVHHTAHHTADESTAFRTAARTTDPDVVQTSHPTAGGRPALLLFHGLTGTPDEVIDLGAALHHKGYDVFMPCLSGHGQNVEVLRKVHTEVWLQQVDESIRAILSLGFSTIVTGGLSFGSLLALEAALSAPARVRGVFLLSSPFHFKKRDTERLLSLLACLPERALDKLGTVEKVKREEGIFFKERKAYTRHSLGASARLFKIRKRVARRLPELRCPILVLHDPHDHHLSADVPARISALAAGSSVAVRQFPGGQHELTLGAHREEVYAEVVSFVAATEARDAHHEVG